MKKLMSLTKVGFVLLILVSTITGCSIGKSRKPVRFGSKLLENCTAKITDRAKSFAIEKKSSETAKSNNKNYLVYFDENNKLKQVSFVYANETSNQTDEESEQIITQEEIKAEVSNIFVTEIFTYVTFIPLGYDDYSSSGFLESYRYTSKSSFACDENHQSFIIHNATHKLYPTNSIGTFTDIKENYVRVDGKFYELTITDGNLVAKKLVPNDNVTVKNILVDKYGNVFVANTAVNQKIGRYYYYVDSSLTCYLGSDGVVYSIKESSYGEFTIKYYNSQMQSFPIPDSTEVRFDNYIIRDNYLYCFIGSDFVRFFKIKDGETHLDLHVESIIYDSVRNFYLAKTEIFVSYKENGTKNLYNFNTKTVKTGKKISEFTTIEVSGDRLILKLETLNGTKVYEVAVVNNNTQLTLLLDTVYENQIIVIQSLN